jgi:glycine cleavage system P protein (glycine dehydrogenase)
MEPGTFLARHIGPTTEEQEAMLATLALETIDDLLDSTVPSNISDGHHLATPEARSEAEALAQLAERAGQNKVLTSLIGLGYYNTITPPVITRNILESPAWYTAYTPYQPEISQGRLEALLNFQTMVADLTGRELANASLLDEPTAAAEAMTLLHRLHKAKGDVFVIDADCLPQTIAVVQTRAEPLGIEVVVADPADPPPPGTFGALLQYPGTSGAVRDLGPEIEHFHQAGALVAVAADLLALCLLRPPGEMGADVVVGSAQRFGVPLGFGGPHAGYMAVRDDYRRSLPGRLVGVSVDEHGNPALRLALQTREQHIRREKATSNICTAQVLLAVMAGAYAVYHGQDGLRSIAQRVHDLTTSLAAGLRQAGIEVVNGAWFDTITVRVPSRGGEVIAAAEASGINLRPIDADHVGVSLDETTDAVVVGAVLAAFGATPPPRATPSPVPSELLRTSEFCGHPVFVQHRSETAMLRYLRLLSDRDLALDRTMIPLGSCTMKLNATSEMIPITWSELADIHPFVPADQRMGYITIIEELESWLADITGYDKVSVQPNAGSQGELAGLLAIRAYHRSRGDADRHVCLIPSSAHGTNAASAAMAGMSIVVVDCDADGNVDIDDLQSKCGEHIDDLSALMVTYPSTHGVFETAITEICDLVHRHGGQVYLDGANLNAMVGLARPGAFGADVSHLNLHKTFCIPHGGGGPGVGPIGVRAHLVPFLPNHPLVADAGPETGVGPISGAPWGSAGILAIPWTYITMMGPDGLTDATAVAVLNANYVAKRLDPHYPVLYTGASGFVAHECIIDLRELTRTTGVTVDDVAKRLMDYGFHAPTMSFPVAGTLMIEPTESESMAELDRFCEAMIAIRAEIEHVKVGGVAIDDSVLRHAPHTAAVVTADDWDRAYPRSLAAFPLGQNPDKYWPPVGRIDGAHGDRHLVCACPPIDAYR